MLRPDGPSALLIAAMRLASLGWSASGIGFRAWPFEAMLRKRYAANEPRLPWSDR